jgi:hypothetical protein
MSRLTRDLIVLLLPLPLYIRVSRAKPVNFAAHMAR